MKETKILSITISLILLSSVILVPIAKAISLDFLYRDNMDFTLCQGCSMTTINNSFGLIANTGIDNITSSDINDLNFTISSSIEGFYMNLFTNQPGEYTPIIPGEVVGSVGSSDTMFMDLIRDDETFRSSMPYQFLALNIGRNMGNSYVGDVYFDIVMEMSGVTTKFQTHAYFDLGAHSFNYISASRTANTVVPEPGTIFLLSSGIIGLACVRKKLKVKESRMHETICRKL